MMWGWIAPLLTGLASVLKTLFGIDKPQQVTTDEKPAHLPPPAPADVLRDLGIAPGANGITGGGFPTDAVQPFSDDGLYAGSNGGGASRADPSGAAAEDFGERHSDR